MSENINDLIKLPVTIEQSDRHYGLRSANSPDWEAYAVVTAHKAIAEFVAQAINSFEANQRRIAELEKDVAIKASAIDNLRGCLASEYGARVNAENHTEQLEAMAEKMLESFIEFIDTLQARGLPLTDQSVMEMERMKADLERLKNG
jgi:uncharacterized coiled-coil protein SlyX